jgi:hypothetical protein
MFPCIDVQYLFLCLIWHVGNALRSDSLIAWVLVESGKRLPAGAVPVIGLQPDAPGLYAYNSVLATLKLQICLYTCF